LLRPLKKATDTGKQQTPGHVGHLMYRICSGTLEAEEQHSQKEISKHPTQKDISSPEHWDMVCTSNFGALVISLHQLQFKCDLTIKDIRNLKPVSEVNPGKYVQMVQHITEHQESALSLPPSPPEM
jgi:hypothetical protein